MLPFINLIALLTLYFSFLDEISFKDLVDPLLALTSINVNSLFTFVTKSISVSEFLI